MNLILGNEKDKLNEELDIIIESKIASIKDVLGETIKRNINSSIQDFYRSDTNILKEDEVYNFKLNLNLNFGYKNIKDCRRDKTNAKNIEFINENTLKISYKNTYLENKYTLYIGDNFMVIERAILYNGRVEDNYYAFYEHRMPLTTIYILKSLYSVDNMSLSYDIHNNIINLCNKSLDNPLLFSSCGQNFEKLCEQEYDEINEMKQDLKNKEKEWENLINEEYDKRDYYNYLESNQKSIEQQQVYIDEEMNKLKLTYDKMKQMRTEIENERKLFEQEKEEYYKKQNENQIDEFDIDSYLTSDNLNEIDNEFHNENIIIEIQK